MKIIAVADLHGLLPNIPECDLLLIGGDIAPDLPVPSRRGSGYAATVKAGQHRQLDWLNTEFRTWLDEIPAEAVVGIAGNHDFGLELPHAMRDLEGLRWTYLRDNSTTIGGLEIYGTPWVPALPNWAFHASDRALYARADAIPKDMDILLTHGPPRGYRDGIPYFSGSQHVGDIPLMERLVALDEAGEAPSVVICGHIHEAFGVENMGDITVINAAFVDEKYEPVNGLTEIVEFS